MVNPLLYVHIVYHIVYPPFQFSSHSASLAIQVVEAFYFVIVVVVSFEKLTFLLKTFLMFVVVRRCCWLSIFSSCFGCGSAHALFCFAQEKFCKNWNFFFSSFLEFYFLETQIKCDDGIGKQISLLQMCVKDVFNKKKKKKKVAPTIRFISQRMFHFFGLRKHGSMQHTFGLIS